MSNDNEKVTPLDPHQRQIVEMLDRLLGRARRGELDGVAIIVQHTSDIESFGTLHMTDRHVHLLGGLAMLQRDIEDCLVHSEKDWELDGDDQPANEPPDRTVS